MKRHDYRSRGAARMLAAIPLNVALPHAGVSLRIIIAGCLALALLVAFELRRLAVLDATLTGLRAQSSAGTRGTLSLHDLETEVGAMRQRAAELALARRRAVLQLNDLARLGNSLPPQTWLTHLRTERDGSWSIEGRSVRLIEIGTALSRLSRIDRDAPVQLISIARAGPRANTLRFAVVWERHT